MEIHEIMADFRRRWEGGFVWVCPPNSTEESLFMVDRITDDNTKIGTLALSSPEYGKILLNMGSAHTLHFKAPPVGVFQNGVDAYMFRRLPQKQYKHGIYNGNSTVWPVYYPMIGKTARANREQLKFDDVLAAFRKERYAFGDALKMLGSGKFRSIALERNFSLCLSPLAKDAYVLLYWESPIASLDTEGNITFVYDKLFETVLQQVKES